MSYLAIDIGGTFIKYALFDSSGEQISDTQKTKTHVTDTQNFILEQVLEICNSFKSKMELQGIAIASAGVVDSQKGSITYAGYTIPGYTGTLIKEVVESKIGVRCTVINDVNAAALGEVWKSFPIEEIPKSLVCLTIGTGVGGAIVLDGQLYEGSGFTAGEVGYMPINQKYFQDIASTTALLQSAKEALGHQVTGEEFFEYLSQQDSIANQVFDSFIDGLAEGLLIIQYLLNPEVIVIGGGVMAQEKVILPAIKEKLKQKAVSERFIQTSIQAAKLGNNAGMLGALYYHFNNV